MKSVKVFVGYEWQKFDECDEVKRTGREVSSDMFWHSIRNRFAETCKKVSKSANVKIEFQRLRATIGQHILPSVLRKIEKADVLLFDIASIGKLATGKQCVVGFNSNVLIELGAALALKKEIIIMCPKGAHAPSDLSGILFAFYSSRKEDDYLVRTFADESGVLSCFSGMLRRACQQHIAMDKVATCDKVN